MFIGVIAEIIIADEYSLSLRLSIYCRWYRHRCR